MDQKVIEDWVGPSRVEEWYEGQAEVHGWNARFWKQRALAASTRRSWDKAESYAEKAAAIHRDPFTTNTLGTILLRKGLEWAEPGSAARWEYYDRAARALHESRDLGRGEYMHPYITFFGYTLRLVNDELTNETPTLRRNLYSLWDDWMRQARWAPAFAVPELRQQLEQYQADWLRLAP
jgi:hypothetical protein